MSQFKISALRVFAALMACLVVLGAAFAASGHEPQAFSQSSEFATPVVPTTTPGGVESIADIIQHIADILRDLVLGVFPTPTPTPTVDISAIIAQIIAILVAILGGN
jgi:hypothetical protein